MVHAALAAGINWDWDYHIIGIRDRMHCQSGAGMECVGLQRDAGERPGTDMPAVYGVMDSGITSRDIHGRLFKIRNLGKRKTTLLHVEAQDGRKLIKRNLQERDDLPIWSRKEKT